MQVSSLMWGDIIDYFLDLGIMLLFIYMEFLFGISSPPPQNNLPNQSK